MHIEFPSRGFKELENTHWSVKDVDLFRVLYSASTAWPRAPKVFKVSDFQAVKENMVSVMMPFAGFDHVYKAIQQAIVASQMECLRADNVWEHAAIIQDIVQIIDEAAIVICDCSGRNANVFYEIGIAHSLGKEVILITQSRSDIPFDLQHLRYITYLNNSEGLAALTNELSVRITKLTTPN